MRFGLPPVGGAQAQHVEGMRRRHERQVGGVGRFSDRQRTSRDALKGVPYRWRVG